MEASTAGREEVRAAHLGRPRTRRLDDAAETVRVELRLPKHVASVLFERADESGRTISRVGSDAIWQSLNSEERSM